MIKAIQRIPTDSYAYIELEMEYESTEDAFIDHQRLLKLHEGGVGLKTKEWAKVRNHMLNTGECDPNLLEEMNRAQRYWINETKLALRAITKEDNNI